jgi:hypothetical protein
MPSPNLNLVTREPAGVSHLSVGNQRSLSEFLHVALNHNLALADRKAGILFTLVSGATLYILQSRSGWPSGHFLSVAGLLWMAMLVSFVVSAGSAFVVIFPRLYRGPSNFLFWGTIGAVEKPAEWLDGLARRKSDELLIARFYHCHALSRICIVKFRLLRIGLIASLLGLISFALLALF